MRSHSTVLGIYQDSISARKGLSRVRSLGFFRSTTIRKRWSARFAFGDEWLIGLVGTFGLLAATYMAAYGIDLAVFTVFHSHFTAHLTAIICAIFLMTGWTLSVIFHFGVGWSERNRYRRWIVGGETFLLVETDADHVKTVVDLLADSQRDLPTTFAFHAESRWTSSDEWILTRTDPPSSEHLSDQARALAKQHVIGRRQGDARSLSSRLNESQRMFDFVLRRIAGMPRTERGGDLSSEWLLDNEQLIRRHFDEYRTSLSTVFYKQLPILKSGSEGGLPRVYAIARSLVDGVDAQVDRSKIVTFLDAYQNEEPLALGELWAAPLMLRLSLLEHLKRLLIKLDQRQCDRQEGDFLANRLLCASRNQPEDLMSFVAQLTQEIPEPSAYLAQQLIGHLYDESSVVGAVRGWIERTLGQQLSDIVEHEQHSQALQQVSLASAIGSLRDLSKIEWRTVVEETSVVEKILSGDPVNIYAAMDFETRDRYRHTIERIARRSKFSEIEVAHAVVDQAEHADSPLKGHVGYYLVDEALPQFEHALGCRLELSERMRRIVYANPALIYIGGIAIFTLILSTGIALLFPESNIVTAVIAIPVIFLVSDIAVNFVNAIISKLLPPNPLPKLDLTKGIPDECKTLIVIPMMLLTPASIRQQIERLGIHWLANQDKNLLFALLADFSDAPEKQMPEDMERLEVAQAGIDELSSQNGEEHFFLLHREREWSKSENCWMGWERKRGKIEDLNRLLMDDPALGRQSVNVHGRAELLDGIRFVITLDADTELPYGTAHRLVGTLAHPLNAPVVSSSDKKVQRGYTIIQPRVSTSLPSATATLFTRLFTDSRGADPYSHVNADLYQDLSGEATYYGKGIYDVAAFHKVATGRFPDAHLLSHDLLESCYVRAGLASDIELFDLFPSDYVAYSGRQHRWIRGDWQIADWLLAKVPARDGKSEPNPLSALSRWKIFDNLRRSLIPLASICTLLIGWMLSGRPMVWTLIVLISCALPEIIGLIEPLISLSVLAPESRSGFKQTLYRLIFNLSMAPQQAFMAIDAIGRVAYRRCISHRRLLEWETAQEAHKRSKNRQRQFIFSLLWVPVLSAAIAVECASLSSATLAAASPFLLLWALSPVIAAVLGETMLPQKSGELSEADQLFLRQIARRTWRFFDDYVSEATNWLPPDNHQASLRVETAPRTSVTNIGLYLLSAHAARDFGYATVDSLVARLERTFNAIGALERPDGHLLNWYGTEDLKPCTPRYVSSVDSGNLLGALWTFIPGVVSFGSDPVMSRSILCGIADTVGVIREHENEAGVSIAERCYVTIDAFCDEPGDRLDTLVNRVRNLKTAGVKLGDSLGAVHAQNPEIVYWTNKLQEQIQNANNLIDRYFSWVEILDDAPIDGLLSLGSSAHVWRRSALASAPGLVSLEESCIPGLAGLVGLAFHRDSNSTISPIATWLNRLSDAVEESRKNAAEEMGRIRALAARAKILADSIDMKFLYDEKKRTFSIGYNMDEHRLDDSYYDLLASESRLGSLVSIARGDVPAKHWTALGRPFAISYGRPALLSWSGTMFEYLMPLLLTKSYPNSLLDLACKSAVECQIEYAKLRGVPWGISESGYSAIDSRQIYQYYAFGVPGLRLKRDMEALLVIAPYASVMALMVDPVSSIANLRRLNRTPGLRTSGKQSMLGECGYYEAVDFSRRTNLEGERGVVVHSFMAHHQGMSLVALDNALNDNIMQSRFHSDPRIQAIESLLYEGAHLAGGIATVLPTASEPLVRERIEAEPPSIVSIDTPDTLSPRVSLLSNSSYSVMVTNAGGGYSAWKDTEITRWRADSTLDSYGSFCYIRDMTSGEYWSTTHQPVKREPSRYSALFAIEKAEIRSRIKGIESITEVVVSPEDDVELRRMTLVNYSSRPRTLEVTSYIELSLTAHNTDLSHPAFGKLFVETEHLPAFNALAARRRARSNSENNPWAFHLLAFQENSDSQCQYETDRAAFIGRGNDLSCPRAMYEPLSESVGAVLDPIFSIRRVVTIKPGERIELSFVLGVAQDKETLERLASKYTDPEIAKRVLELAWTNAQLELRRLKIHSRDALGYQRLASHIVYSGSALRPSPERLRQSTGGPDRLWAHGISGDLPIAAITISDETDLDVVRELLLAHSYWRLKGLKSDLVILNDEPGGYNQPLAQRLRQLVEIHSQTVGSERPGGVFIRPLRQISADDIAVLQSSARIVLVAARGLIGQQLGNTSSSKAVVKLAESPHGREDFPSAPLPFLDLDYHNGRGGFTKDGREYAIYLGMGETTPAPWINVIANENFGLTLSEVGSGVTWAHNSQSNRLTSWSNDPVIDPSSDAIYLRDNELDVVWSPTASPIREHDPYRARHGCGYTVFEHSSHGITQELTVFVPVSDEAAPTVRVQILKLFNNSNRTRHLSLTSYANWTLGSTPEAMSSHIQTQFDWQSQSLFARNSYRKDYPNSVAFLSANRPVTSYTGDRMEFLGRNGSMAQPDAMLRERLSGAVGAGLDPCGAIRIDIEIEQGGEEIIVLLLGEAKNAIEARELISQFGELRIAEKSLDNTRRWWDETLSAVTVNTPIKSVDILLNRWLLYQTLCCRIWARTAFYQSGGAYGFRDQLQDSMALLYSRPKIAREQILRSAARQFVEGDVQHWWHVESGAGTRTRISDDLLWLPFVTAQYVRVTGDSTILDEQIPWLNAPILAEEEHEVFSSPQVTEKTDTLLEHCRRAIAKGATSGSHGLPLIGGGDWNDGLNRVGVEGKGESVWLAWFLVHVHRDMAELLRLKGENDEAEKRENNADVLSETVEQTAWDGEWYKRAFFDDGSALGASSSDEAKIDSLAQSWSVIAGGKNRNRSIVAMNSVETYLIKSDIKIVLLFTPPFDKTQRDPGYIKGYVPGVRENGGQYTHGALWVPMALARLGDNKRAVETLQYLNPIEHSRDAVGAALYAVEPYVAAADVYALKGKEGRGGWTWYTGSAAWMYRIWIEEALGLHLRGDFLKITPVIPESWDGFTIRLKHGAAYYNIRVFNSASDASTTASITLDGESLASGAAIPLNREAAGEHEIIATI